MVHWEIASRPPDLLDNEIHIWRINLDALAEKLAGLKSLLSEDEKEKADHYYFEKDAKRYQVARSVLRILLAKYLNAAPDCLEFDQNPYGRPMLRVPQLTDLLNFNVSHSSFLAVLAFGRMKEIGVDIEEHRADFVSLEVAKRFFSASETESLVGLGQDEFIQTFFNCWTRKEAYIKAKGMGLSLALDSFAIETSQTAFPKLQFSKHFPADSQKFMFVSFSPWEKFSAALAIKSKEARIRFFDYIMNT